MTELDGNVLESVVERITAERGAPRAGLVAGLARAAYRRAPAPHADPAAVGRLLSAALDFIDGRQPGTLGLRVTNPEDACTVVDINVDDAPFLLSTVHAELAGLGLEVATVLHPIIGVQRRDDGSVAAVLPAREAASREAWIHIELSRRLPPDQLPELEGALRAVLDDTLAATGDYPAMREQVDEAAFDTRASAGARFPLEEVDETIALLDWLLDDHFVFLGAREYDLVAAPGGGAGERAVVVRAGSGLGILADESTSTYAEPVPLTEIPEDLRRRIEGGDLLLVSRTNRLSTVHRREPMIYIGVKKVDGEGRVEGEHRFLGLFSHKAFAEAASTVPVLRRKLRTILEWEDIVEQSYEERAVRALFEALPKHELFQADVAHLHASLMTLLDSDQRQDVRLVCRMDPQARSASALVVVPRDRFNARMRERVQRLLVERFEAASVDYHLSITEGGRALLHFLLHTVQREVAVDALEREVLQITRTWEDDLAAELEQVHGAAEGQRLAHAYSGAFPPGYTDRTTVVDAVADIAELEQLTDVRMALTRESPPPGGTQRHDSGGQAGDPVAVRPAARGTEAPLRFRLYKTGTGVELSTFLPILESLGLTIVEEIPHRLAVGDGVTLHDFGVRAPDGVEVDIARDGPRLAAAAQAVWNGRAHSDSLNRLVLHAGLTWDDVTVLRAYRRYRRQVGTAFTDQYQADALVEHPHVGKALCDLFAAHFDPGCAEHPELAEDARGRVLAGCEAVERLDQDRILRGFLGMVEATLRTNRYRPGRSCLCLKLDSARVPDMPKPVPHVEVFVYAPDMEGVHLRGGPVARGGIRWSDRQEDVRTEVLGLMKAQMVKNALIVPTGSKGGFVLKRPPADPAALRLAVRDAYARYIRALLDITDNVVGKECEPAPGVRRRDGDDPYLVVAADRGTATFSDTANAISTEYGFWLADAFASGGSAGYDHKEMGITARGAWVAVQRHFRELEIDVQADPVTVVGIGDMSGDVFGNGLLRSPTVRLVGAFDHRHVFLDPDPDAAASYDERLRLFGLAGSSWVDYDRSVISPGGGVWSRNAKSVPLSAQARSLLRLDEPAVSPADLIRALLTAPVDLLFAGGIGTFVKASTESHAKVGDRANDAVRVDASALGARVVGEGGNLALTQRARIEYARRGGRCNTDAVDNAGGVATSDREVNLKILLRSAIDHGVLPPEARDELLASMTQEVAAAVLRDVYLQAWAISREVAGSHLALESYEHLMTDLARSRPGAEAATRLDRGVEALPASAEVERRRQAGAGLTRPEVAVVLGYAKLDLAERLLASDLLEWPALAPTLHGYFPQEVRQRFGDLVGQHRLRRELVATTLANDVVNRMGSTYVSRTGQELGAATHEVAAAYWAARQVADADGHWRDVEALDGEVTPALQLELAGLITNLVDAFTRRYLRRVEHDRLAAVIGRDRPAFRALAASILTLGSANRRAARRGRLDRYADLGLAEELTLRVVSVSELAFVPDVAEVSERSGRPVTDVAEVFLALSELLPLDALHARLGESAAAGHWERWQVRGLVDDLQDVRRQAAARAIQDAPSASGLETVDRFLAGRQTTRARVDAVVEHLQREPDAGIDGVAVAVRALRELVS